MKELAEQILALSPEERKLLEMQLKSEGIDLAGYLEAGQGMQNLYAGIKPAALRESYQMSAAQKRLFVLHQLDADSLNYNIPALLIAEGDLSREKFEETFRKLIQRHESLRTSFEIVDGESIQRICPSVEFQVEYWEMEDLEAADSNLLLQDPRLQSVIRCFVRPFALHQAPLLRAGLIKLAGAKHLVMVDMHHIISDGASMAILIRDFIDLYNGRELRKLALQYKDYAVWQNELQKNGRIKQQEQYWLQIFSGGLPVLNLPADYPRPAIQSFEGARIEFQTGGDLARRLRQIAAANGATLFMVLLAAFYVLLFKYTNQEDIIIGSPVAGRSSAELENIIGMFVNTLALRNFPKGAKTFTGFLAEVKENSLKAFENQDYQFEELVEKLQLRRDLSRNALFDVMFALHNYDIQEINIPGLSFRVCKFDFKIANFDLTLDAIEQENEICFTFEYCSRLFQQDRVERMAGHYLQVLRHIAASPDSRLAGIDMVTEAEKRQILLEFNPAMAELPKGQTVLDFFEEQVRLTPEARAVSYEDQHLTYAGLNDKANQLARELRKKGIGPNCIVAVMLERSLEMITGVMAVMKAGGAYLPVDPKYPIERVQYMLEDSGTSLLLSKSGLGGGLKFRGDILDILDPALYSGGPQNLGHVHQSRDLAYVIYTSGTTGKPKGVLVEHGSLLNISLAWQRAYHLKEMDVRLLQMASFSFDVFTGDLARSLLNGGEMVICPELALIDPPALYDLIIRRRINILESTPQVIIPLMEHIHDNNLDISPLQLLILGSDKCPVEDFQKLRLWFPNIRIINSYGVTEATIDASFYESNSSGKLAAVNLPIGKPLANIQFHILNPDLQLQPAGIPGELYIGGRAVARGYLNRPDLTREKFIPHPGAQDERLYKTGDLARWLPDGNVEFMGRIDNQVKIRGYRIELGEIESVILSFAGVKEAAVAAKGAESDSKVLGAYITSDREIAVQELKEYLAARLPDYMVPSFFIQLSKLPLTANGKVDHKALPDPEGQNRARAEYLAPRNRLEASLAAIWQEILKVDPVGINDNFFELGGHSLKATILTSRIHKELNLELPLREVFQRTTIREQAEYLARTTVNTYASIQPVLEWEDYPAGCFPVSSAQKRLYILSQLEGQGTSYNMPAALIIEGPLERARLEAAFCGLIQRHESLRTSFELFNNIPVQRIHPAVEFQIEYQEMEDDAGEEGGNFQAQDYIRKFIRPFDLSRAPLLRVGLIKISAARHILMFDISHIISDGISTGVLIEEFTGFYEGRQLPGLRIQYKDYAAWQNEQIKAGRLQKQKEYWLQAFAGELPALDLATDFPRPAVRSFEGGLIRSRIGPELARRINRLAAETQTTVYMILLAALNIMLYKYTGREDIVIGSPVAGRPHADLERLIGMFVNTLAMRNYPAGSKTFKEFLAEVKENALQAYQNQDYQFEELVEALNLQRDLSRNPLFDVMFVLQNTENKQIEIQGLQFIPYEFENNTAKFDLVLQAVEEKDGIDLSWEYWARLFKAETVNRFAQHLTRVLETIIARPGIALREIELITETEKQQILIGFNATKTEFPHGATIYELFEWQAEQTPDQIVLVFQDQSVTYRELNAKANQLARRLRNKGIKPDSIVGIIMDRSLELAVAVLGVLKAGAAYLPIDPAYPVERINYLLMDCSPRLLLTDSVSTNKFKFTGETVRFNFTELSGETANLAKVNKPEDLAYVIYTSGTTGRPKGVLIEHQSIANTILWRAKEYALTRDDLVLQLFSFSFDGFLTSFFTPIVSGAGVLLLDGQAAKDPFAIKEQLRSHKITHFICVPALYRAILEIAAPEDFKYLRMITLAGEKVEADLVLQSKRLNPQVELKNEYGPTENSVASTYYRDLQAGGPVSIGKPIANTQVYLVNQEQQLQPIGVFGEICLTGRGLARGYLNQPELTAARFVPNPFALQTSGAAFPIMYRTGDLGRWFPDGNIEFSGRIDHQVKIRGFRIEPGEIEARLLKHEAVKDALVIAREDKYGGKYLCAYVVTGQKEAADPETGGPAEEQESVVGKLRDYLAGILPDYMIPSYFVRLSKIPLTANGKVDSSRLPEPEKNSSSRAEYKAPETELEQKLAIIWQELLGIDRAGIHDNFFEIGGNSLSIIKLQAMLDSEYPNQIRVVDLFANPTIFQLARFIFHKIGCKGQQPAQLRRIQDDAQLERELNQMFDALEEGKLNTGQFIEKMIDR
ncbi:MAG: amino acid adenylation domain-containing protein [Firmicutes bacterium]|nr:amino acid adenylation domain-containing protein [Bacillota bacterium]